MKQILEISYSHYDKLEELGTEDLALVREAEEATKNANAAYSHFHVGPKGGRGAPPLIGKEQGG